MVRITPELVENSPQFTNAIRDRELDLRGYKFPVIENMGSTLDQFDTIDFSENELRKLDGFPLLKRLKCLILTNNKIVRLADDLGQQLPNLDTLILTGNAFSELRELEPLSTCNKLTFLSLVHCPVTMRSNYRLFVISRVPTIRFLDYRRVTHSERKLANSMFRRLPALATTTTTPAAAKPGAGRPMVNGAVRNQQPPVKTFVPGAPLNQPSETNAPAPPTTTATATSRVPIMPPPVAPIQTGTKRSATGGSTQDLFAIQEAIKRARTMEEVEKLHQLLSSGQFAGFASYWQQARQQQQQDRQQQQQPPPQPEPEQQQEQPSQSEQQPKTEQQLPMEEVPQQSPMSHEDAGEPELPNEAAAAAATTDQPDAAAAAAEQPQLEQVEEPEIN